MCSHLCCLHTAIHISSLCGFWHCHPYIPIHFWKMFFILVLHIGTVLYYDGSVEYFGRDHLPYAVLAITVLLVFTVLPILLLCLYPCHWFQRFLNSCHLRNQALHTFMDTFQGCYKDGTNGTRDCRYFAAVYLITRVVVYLSIGLTLVSLNISVLTIIFTILALLVASFHPYKQKVYNRLDVFLLLSLTVFAPCAWVFLKHTSDAEVQVARIVICFIATSHVVCTLCLVLYYILRKSRRLQLATERISLLLKV